MRCRPDSIICPYVRHVRADCTSQVPPRWRASIDNATTLALQAEFIGTALFVYAAGMTPRVLERILVCC